MFDYDWGLQDDFMGLANIDLTTLELEKYVTAYTFYIHLLYSVSKSFNVEGYISRP